MGWKRKKWLIQTVERTFSIICEKAFEDVSNERPVSWIIYKKATISDTMFLRVKLIFAPNNW